MVRVSKEISHDNLLQAPTVTICESNEEYGNDWENSSLSYNADGNSFDLDVCGGHEGDLLLSCSNNQTYTLAEIIFDAKIGDRVVDLQSNFTST